MEDRELLSSLKGKGRYFCEHHPQKDESNDVRYYLPTDFKKKAEGIGVGTKDWEGMA